MGSIGPDPSEIVLATFIYYLFIAPVGGWILYQFRIMRHLLAIVTYLFSCLLLIFLFFQTTKNIAYYALFMPSIAYGISAYYLAQCGLFTQLLKGINFIYLVVAAYFTLQVTFSVNYESEVLFTLIDLAVCIGSNLFVPISMLILLGSLKKTASNART